MFTLGVLLAEIWILMHIAPGTLESFFAKPETTLPISAAIAGRPAESGLKAFLAPRQFVVATMLLIVTLGISMSVEFREKIPARKPLSQFPLAVSSWEGTRQYMEQQFITQLDLSDYVIVDYQNSSGRPVNFYVAYYESQRKGESVHSPETCLPGSGWVFQQAGKTSLTLPDGRTITVNRAIMEKSGQQQISYFWFPARGRILTNAWEMKLYTFWDALTEHRTDGALVRVITPVLAGERPQAAEERLHSFVKDIAPILNQFLPN
jgi:EpsI family protein